MNTILTIPFCDLQDVFPLPLYVTACVLWFINCRCLRCAVSCTAVIRKWPFLWLFVIPSRRNTVVFFFFPFASFYPPAFCKTSLLLWSLYKTHLCILTQKYTALSWWLARAVYRIVPTTLMTCQTVGNYATLIAKGNSSLTWVLKGKTKLDLSEALCISVDDISVVFYKFIMSYRHKCYIYIQNLQNIIIYYIIYGICIISSF